MARQPRATTDSMTKKWLIRVASVALRPIVAEMLREESDYLVRWAVLLEQSHEKVFKFRIDRDGSFRQRVHLLGLAPRDGVLAPLLHVFEHLLLESFPWNPKRVETFEECLENQPQELCDEQRIV
jgi:hypothetical protein